MPKFNKGAASRFAGYTGYEFIDNGLLATALTHGSHRASGKADYQRLEFFGDRILGLVIAEWLYRNQPKADEGKMARQFTHLVRKDTCAEVARALRLDEIMRSGPGIDNLSGKAGTKILGDVCEAVIAAIYLDSGFDAARSFVLRHWQEHFETAIAAPRDAKSRLQEWALAKGLDLPGYRELSRSGPDHSPNFEIEVSVNGYDPATASASSKRNGEQAAASAFIKRERIKLK